MIRRVPLIATSGKANGQVSRESPSPHLVVRLKERGIAIPAALVREIAPLPRVVPVPGAPPFVRGVVNVRGEVIPVTDLRLRLGLTTRAQEIDEVIRTLHEREQDHRNWIRELEASVQEKRPFTLARDPHLCKFGKWYDTYVPDVRALALIWSGFDLPHKTIHALADVVLGYAEQGDTARALAEIERARRTDLAALIGLFADAVRALTQSVRELVVILRRGERTTAISVDAAEAVEPLVVDGVMDLPLEQGEAASDLIIKSVWRPDGGEILFLLETDRLFGDGRDTNRAAA